MATTLTPASGAASPSPPPKAAEPEFLTAQQVADTLNVSLSTVLRRFSQEPGVVDLGRAGRRRGQRPYRMLRIPRGVLSRFLYEHRSR